MKSFIAYIRESSSHANNSQNISYRDNGQQALVNPGSSGTNFATNKVSYGQSEGIDVRDWDEEEEENKPWQIREADIAAKRHGELIKWLSVVDPDHASQIPELPDWQDISKKKS